MVTSTLTSSATRDVEENVSRAQTRFTSRSVAWRVSTLPTSRSTARRRPRGTGPAAMAAVTRPGAGRAAFEECEAIQRRATRGSRARPDIVAILDGQGKCAGGAISTPNAGYGDDPGGPSTRPLQHAPQGTREQGRLDAAGSYDRGWAWRRWPEADRGTMGVLLIRLRAPVNRKAPRAAQPCSAPRVG